MKLIGPDTHSNAEFNSEGLQWWRAFAAQAGQTVNAYTFHMYSLGNGQSLDPHNLPVSFLNPDALDRSREGAEALMEIVSSEAAGRELWGGETASAYSGGQSGVTDTYINGFWYLDQLGAHAAVGVQVFQRQAFLSGGGYPMVNMPQPLPDYWVALLHKRLMGQRVLAVESSSRMLRAYAHCAVGGGVAFALLNLADKEVAVSLGDGLGHHREEWILEAGDPLPGAPNRLQSQETLLNGAKLTRLKGPSLPDLPGRVVSGSTVSLPATSYAFVRLVDAAPAACATYGGMRFV